MTLKVQLKQTTDQRILSALQNIKPLVDDLCQHLVSECFLRKLWAELIDEFRSEYDVLGTISLTYVYSHLLREEQRRGFSQQIVQDYIYIFIFAHSQADGSLQQLIGAVPEGLVFHLLNRHPDSVGQAQREVHIEIDNNGDVWRSNVSERSEARSLDVAFWDSTGLKGRGFECKIAHVAWDSHLAVVELLSTIYEKTGGCFETVLFSFCKTANAVKKFLNQNLEDESARNRLDFIKFIGYEHLADFDGTTSCCGGSPQSCLPGGSAPRLTT
ncbi:hypothetical protein KAX21_05280 [candidate division WOR-3 bacterium]|nr:hypothetical protein [candidate division WOR-3 bacterium]